MANIEDLIQRARTIRIETKSKKNTAARIGGLLLDIVNCLGEAQVLKKAQYGGIVATSSDLVSDYTDKGYSGPYFYLVGSSLSSLVVYQYAGSGSPAQVFGGAAYDFSDYSEVVSRLDLLAPKIGEVIEIPVTYPGKYIALDIINGNTVNMTRLVNASYNCRVLNVSEGDVLIVSGEGGASPRLWGFIDSENKMLQKANANATATDLRVVAPANAARAIINDKSGSTSYVLYASQITVVRKEDVVNDLTTGGTNPLAAEQGKILAAENVAIRTEVDGVDAKVNAVNTRFVGSSRNYKTGKCYSTSGSLSVSSNGAYIENYIPVEAGDTIIWHSGCDDTVTSFNDYSIVLYDTEKNYVSRVAANKIAEKTITLGSDSTARFVRACFNVNVISECFIKVNGTTVWSPTEDVKGIEERIEDLEEGSAGGGSVSRTTMFDFSNPQITDVSAIVSGIYQSATSKKYLIMQTVYDKFDALVAAYPNVITKQDAGTLVGLTYPSYANLDGADSQYGIATPTYRTYIYTISIGASANLGTKKKLLLFGATHGFESMGPIDLTALATRLCTAADVNMIKMLMYFDIYIVPCFNGFGIINGKRGNGNGVDLNRNFPTSDWTQTESGSVYYSGPSAGSEFETQLAMGLVDLLKPDFVLDHHSYDDVNNYNFYTKVPSIMVEASKAAKADLAMVLMRDYPQYYGTLNGAFGRGILKRPVSPSQESTPGSLRSWVTEQGLPGILIECAGLINYNNGAFDAQVSTYFSADAENIAFFTLEHQLLRYVECIL